MRLRMNYLNLCLATLNDVEELTALAEKFHEESKNPQSFDYEVTRDNIEAAVNNFKEWLVLSLKDGTRVVGMLIAVIIPSLFGNDRLAVELAWYVDPSYRKTKKSLEMLKMYEYWAEHLMSADLISMSTLDDERIGKVYNKLGYEKSEDTYVKRFGGVN